MLPPLPEISDRSLPGAVVVRRVVSMTLAIVGLLAVIGIVTSLVVTVRVTEDGDGTLEPVFVWQVRGLEGGVVSAMLVSAGDTVKLGQPVARLDPLTARATVSDLEKALAAAQ